MKTIAQIAKEIGVSSQAVYKKIKKEPLSTSLKGLLTTADNKIHIVESGEALIKSAFERKGVSTVSTNQVDNLSTISTEFVKSLQAQISVLQVQNEDLRKENSKLTEKVLEQADKIMEQSEKLLPLLSQAQSLANNAQTLHAMEKPQITDGKKGILSRIFKKNQE